MLPAKLLHYEILEKIGQGGMGTVYKGRDARLGRPVAVKALAGARTTDPDSRQRFVQEARAASALNHPNIVTIYDIIRENDSDVIVMEYVEGETLQHAIQNQRLGLKDALRAAIQIASALAGAHEAGIIHRDLKPANVILRKDGLVKIVDFGLAKLVDRSPAGGVEATQTTGPHTQAGMVLGTLCYMSPEQAEGKNVDGRSDVFSFGAVLYEMLTGRRAFEGDSPAGTLSSLLRDEPVPPRQLVADVPAELEAIVSRCLRKDPARRFQTMTDVRAALQDVLEESGSRPGQAATPSVRRGTGKYIATGIVAAASLLVGVTLWLSRLRPVESTQAPTQLTLDSGYSAEPAVSADGRLLAYASDRAGNGDLDIWVRQMTGGEALRVTESPADEYAPSFSPDGSWIVFRSDEGAGGIFLVSALGGQPREIAGSGFDPVFSPDGSSVAYVELLVRNSLDPGNRIMVTPLNGGAPRQVPTDLVLDTPRTAWSSDGAELMVLATPRDAPDGEADLWAIPVSGGSPRKLGIREALTSAGIRHPMVEFATAGSSIIASLRADSHSDIWQIPSPGEPFWKRGSLRRLAFAEGNAARAAADREGRIVYAASSSKPDLLSLFFDTKRADPEKPVTARYMTRDTAHETGPELSPDGRRLVFASNRSGSSELWMTHGDSNHVVQLTFDSLPGPGIQDAHMSQDGRAVAFRRTLTGGTRHPLFLVSVGGGTPKKFCESGFIAGWLSDRSHLIYTDFDRNRATGTDTLLALDTVAFTSDEFQQSWGQRLQDMRTSPDGKWLLLCYQEPGAFLGRCFVAPLRRGRAAERSEWVQVADTALNARWAPSADAVFYYSEAGDARAGGIWLQRLDASTKHPQGSPEFVYGGKTRSRVLPLGLAVGADRIVLPATEMSGNIWTVRTTP